MASFQIQALLVLPPATGVQASAFPVDSVPLDSVMDSVPLDSVMDSVPLEVEEDDDTLDTPAPLALVSRRSGSPPTPCASRSPSPAPMDMADLEDDQEEEEPFGAADLDAADHGLLDDDTAGGDTEPEDNDEDNEEGEGQEGADVLEDDLPCSQKEDTVLQRDADASAEDGADEDSQLSNATTTTQRLLENLPSPSSLTHPPVPVAQPASHNLVAAAAAVPQQPALDLHLSMPAVVDVVDVVDTQAMDTSEAAAAAAAAGSIATPSASADAEAEAEVEAEAATMDTAQEEPAPEPTPAAAAVSAPVPAAEVRVVLPQPQRHGTMLRTLKDAERFFAVAGTRTAAARRCRRQPQRPKRAAAAAASAAWLTRKASIPATAATTATQTLASVKAVRRARRSVRRRRRPSTRQQQKQQEEEPRRALLLRTNTMERTLKEAQVLYPSLLVAPQAEHKDKFDSAIKPKKQQVRASPYSQARKSTFWLRARASPAVVDQEEEPAQGPACNLRVRGQPISYAAWL